MMSNHKIHKLFMYLTKRINYQCQAEKPYCTFGLTRLIPTETTMAANAH